MCIKLFSRYGYAGVSIKQIADEAGLSKGSLYHYFSSKEEILIACAINYISELSQCISAFESPNLWVREFYKKKLSFGCFMFNMMACEDSATILDCQIKEFIEMMNIKNVKCFRALIGVLLQIKFQKNSPSTSKALLSNYINYIED